MVGDLGGYHNVGLLQGLVARGPGLLGLSLSGKRLFGRTSLGDPLGGDRGPLGLGLLLAAGAARPPKTMAILPIRLFLPSVSLSRSPKRSLALYLALTCGLGLLNGQPPGFSDIFLLSPSSIASSWVNAP